MTIDHRSRAALFVLALAALGVLLGLGATTAGIAPGAGGDTTLARTGGSLGAFGLVITAVIVLLAGQYARLAR